MEIVGQTLWSLENLAAIEDHVHFVQAIESLIMVKHQRLDGVWVYECVCVCGL